MEKKQSLRDKSESQCFRNTSSVNVIQYDLSNFGMTKCHKNKHISVEMLFGNKHFIFLSILLGKLQNQI